MQISSNFQPLADVRYVVGSRSDEMFVNLTPELAMKHFEDAKKGSIPLNYTDREVELALTAEYNIDNAAGMTQETYNCESDDEGIQFPELEQNNWTGHDGSVNLYARFNPLFKELVTLLEGVDKDLENEIESSFQAMIKNVKEFHASKLPQPKGNIVSCMPINLRSKASHTKQKKHH